MLTRRLRPVVHKMTVRAAWLNSEKNGVDTHWIDSLRQSYQMKGILLHRALSTVHTFDIKIPFLGGRRIVMPFSFSEFSAHGSFVLLTLSYLESDFLHLRVFAFFGTLLSIIFQYFREKPLWIPIRWNSLFVLINAVMILILLKDKNDADNIPEEQKFLYTTVFQSKGMSAVDFLHLISCAKRIEHKKGDKLVSESMKNTRVCLVKKGKLVVTRGGEKVGTINQNQFVGAMSFLTWASKMDAEDHALRLEEEEEPITLSALVAAVPHLLSSYWERIAYGLARLFGVDANSITTFRRQQDEEFTPEKIAAALQPSEPLEMNPLNRNYYHPSTDSTEGGDDYNDHNGENAAATPSYADVFNAFANMLFPGSVSESTDGAAAASGATPAGTPTTPNTEDATVVTTSNGQQTKESNESKENNENEGQSGWADVVCEEDCLVFSWTFRDLYELVRENPSMGMVLERCISEDLNKKMANSWQDEPKNRYKQLLTGALIDEEVSAKKRALLARHATELHISPEVHVETLHSLGWTEEEYDCGYKRKSVPADVVTKYSRLVKRCMDSEEGITEDDRGSLLRFRQAAGITRPMHVAVVNQLGWTMDEYESGNQRAYDESASSAPITLDMIIPQATMHMHMPHHYHHRHFERPSVRDTVADKDTAIAAVSIGKGGENPSDSAGGSGGGRPIEREHPIPGIPWRFPLAKRAVRFVSSLAKKDSNATVTAPVTVADSIDTGAASVSPVKDAVVTATGASMEGELTTTAAAAAAATVSGAAEASVQSTSDVSSTDTVQ